MNIFEQYGVKDVADVTLYSIHRKKDGSGQLYYVPALHLDTLKISSLEQTAESTWAQGGHGNARLVGWDFNKEINVSLQDALCTPASMSLCWGGILSADWKDAHVDIDANVSYNKMPLTKIDRMEKVFYPRPDGQKHSIGTMLPRVEWDKIDGDLELLKISSVVDGTVVKGTGVTRDKTYRWKMAVESAVKSIAQIPDRFFDMSGKMFTIDVNRKVSIFNLEAPTYANYKDAIIYKINSASAAVPPLAKIIFDGAMENQGEIVNITVNKVYTTVGPKMSYGAYLIANGFTVTEDLVCLKDGELYIPLTDLKTKLNGELSIDDQYVFEGPDTFYHVIGEELKSRYTSTTSVDLNVLESVTITYDENHATTDLMRQVGFDHYGSVEDVKTMIDTCMADYLAIIIDNDNNYKALVGQVVDRAGEENYNKASKTVVWHNPRIPIDTEIFKGLDLWLRFESINEMIYFLITKYKEDIVEIDPSTINTSTNPWSVNVGRTDVVKNTDKDSNKAKGKLWAYINPKTMTPYGDDYWFHQGEPFYVASFTMAEAGKALKGKSIAIKADRFPGIYMLVGETSIRDRETGEDSLVQIKIPCCKVKSEQTIELTADGEPVVFDLNLEVAKPASGAMVEFTAFETAQKMQIGENGLYKIVDGSTEVLSE